MQIDATWWITLLAAPIAALFWMLHAMRQDLRRRRGRGEPGILIPMRDELMDFKLEVARTYVPLSLIRDVDRRLSQHLLRIEEKIEEINRIGKSRARERTDHGA